MKTTKYETAHRPAKRSLWARFVLWAKTKIAQKCLGNTPLIWTTKGNLPIDALEWHYGWEDNEQCTVYIDTYYFKGEKVKEARAILAKQGLPPIGLHQANLM